MDEPQVVTECFSRIIFCFCNFSQPDAGQSKTRNYKSQIKMDAPIQNRSILS